MAFRDGDGWVLCTRCQSRHWGLHGAAGLLLVRTDLEIPCVLLQLRAAWTHGGGTCALPGGALDSHEDSVTAAAREAHEEAGIEPQHLEFKAVFSDDHGNWRYDTVIAHTKPTQVPTKRTPSLTTCGGCPLTKSASLIFIRVYVTRGRF